MGNNGVKAWVDDGILRNKDTICNLVKKKIGQKNSPLWKEEHQINTSYQDNSS